MNISAKTHASYNPLSRVLHWSIAIGIGLNYWLAERAEHLQEQSLDMQALAALANHKSVGMTIFMLALLRLVWRQYAGRPMLPSMPAWQLLAANATHYLMYIVLIGLPLTGWLGSSASAYSVSWFNVFAFPDIVGASEVLAEQLFELHELLWAALQILLLLHVLAAVKHGLYNGDGVFTSMWSWRVVLGSLVVIALLAGAVWQLQLARSGEPAQAENAEFIETEVTATDLELMAKRWQLQTADTQPWDIDHAQSNLEFEASQAGAAFTGQFKQWQGRIVWRADALDVAGIDVRIDLGSVNTQDDERDGYLRDTDFFSIQQFPQARFLATWVRANSGLELASEKQSDASQYAYVAEGYLQMKAAIRPVKLWFNVVNEGAGIDGAADSNRLRLQGQAVLNRHRWHIGEGEWADDAWLGPEVTVRVDVVANVVAGATASSAVQASL